jgi:enoyl-CoA hydratase
MALTKKHVAFSSASAPHGDDVPDRSVRYAQHGQVAVLQVDDGKANALSPALIGELHDGLDRAAKEAAAVLLVGRAGRFSAGFDLGVMTGGLDGLRGLVKAGADVLLRLYLYPRPVVAACTGHALAAGALLLLAADLRIGARGPFKIGLNEVAIQLTLPAFGMELARDRLAKRWFTAATTQAHIFDPDSAREAGYLDLVVDADALFETALAHAERLAALPHPAFRDTKQRERQATVDRVRRTLDDDIASLTTPVPA